MSALSPHHRDAGTTAVEARHAGDPRVRRARERLGFQSRMSPLPEPSPEALAFRVVHAGIAVMFLGAIADIWWCALTRRRNRALRPAIAALAVEGTVVAVNHGDCPLGPLQDRVGDPVPLFELVLSPAAAKRAVPVLGLITAVGVALLARPPRTAAAA